jgi:D-amino-acid dehydrogenase
MAGQKSDVIVIGGGVVGAACAYYLAQAGLKVRVLEAGRFGGGCSHGNCGMICPSHVLPLAGPGAVRKVLRAMVRGNAPLAVRPGLNLALWSWLWKFSRCCREDLMWQSAVAMNALLVSSRRLYDELRQRDEFDCEWQDKGLLFVYNSQRDFEQFGCVERLVRERFGVRGTRIEGAQLEDVEPALKEGLAGAWHYEGDSHLRPDKLMASWQRLLIGAGADIVENSPVQDVELDGDAIRSVATSDGRQSAGAYVLAAGALSPALARRMNCRLPIQPGKGYSITMPLPQGGPTTPMILEQYHVGVTPMVSGYRLGSTMELVGYDATINRKRLALLKKGADECLRAPYCEPILEEWCGWRPMTYDGLPCLGRAPRGANAFIAAGHGMLGMSTAPGSGKLLAEIVVGADPHIDPAPYSPARF